MRRSSRWFPAAGAGLALALAAWVATALGAVYVCSIENSECAHSHERRTYRGRLFDYEGRPSPRTTLLFSADIYGDDFGAPVETDERGRFCVLAIHGSTTPTLRVPGQVGADQLVVRSSAPVDPRFAQAGQREWFRRRGSAYTGVDLFPFMTVEPAASDAIVPSPSVAPIGAHNAVEAWNPHTDAARTCRHVDANPPWYRFRDLTQSVQFAALNIAPLLTFFLFAFGVGARKTGRRKSSPGWARTAERAFQATGGTAVATAILFVVLWQIV